MDLLTAVNTILPFLETNPVTTIDSKHPTVAAILASIDNARLLTLSDGYWFNKERKTFYLTPESKILAPTSTLALYPTKNQNYEIRGDYIYDLDNGSFTFTEGFDATIYTDIKFEELPLFAALTVQWRAAVDTYTQDYGIESTVKMLIERESEALALLERENLRKLQYSAMRSNPGFRYMSALRS